MYPPNIPNLLYAKSRILNIPAVITVPKGWIIIRAINTPIIKVKSGVKNVSSITGTIFLTFFSRYATIIPINNDASNPPIPGAKGLPVKGSITALLSSTLRRRGSAGFATKIDPIIPPSTAVPPNSFAAFIPTYIARYPNIANPILLIAANHHTVL